MPLAHKISKSIVEEECDVPEEIEHDLIKDSVLEIANTNFKISDDFDELPAGQIRRNAQEELSAEYEGKPVSRKTFSQRNWMNDKVSDDSEDSGDEVQDNDESLMDSDEFSDDGDEEKSLDESIDENDETKEEESMEESGMESEEEESKMTGKSDSINIFSTKAKNIEDEIKKGNAIKNQLLLWENLIECRIKLQKGLVASNRLMQKEAFAAFKSQLTADELSTVNSAYKGLVDLLENFIQLKECLLKKCPEYVTFKKGGIKEVNKNDDDEEITSESENDEEEKKHESIYNTDDEESPPAKKRKTIEDYSEYFNCTARSYQPFRDFVIQKWNDKTRLASGKIGISKFAILEQSTLKQIEQILLDKDRLVKRTQTRRSKLPVLGKIKPDEEESKDNDEDDDLPQQSVNKEELDSEIFDDDDFYHKLLKDFIDRKTSDVTDPTQLGRQWTKLQKLRSKMKRKVDTRATKGRKLRYTVHNKLVNFMAPIPYSTWDDKVEQDLFRSLFGQASLANGPAA